MDLKVKRLRKQLYTSAKQAFSSIITDLSDDGIYSLALYTSSALLYLHTTCATYRGLEEVARRYQQKEFYFQEPLEHLKDILKWSPGDSPHHQTHAYDLGVDDLMWELHEQSYELFEKGKNEELGALDEQIESTILNVLKQLDREGVFGKGKFREGIVVNFLTYDQSDEARLYYALELNPRITFLRYALEIEFLRANGNFA